MVTLDDPNWLPDREFLRQVLDYVGATEVWHMAGYSIPLSMCDWETASAHRVYEFFGTMSPERALDVMFSGAELPAVGLRAKLRRLLHRIRPHEREKVAVTILSVYCEQWSRSLCESLKAIPESLTEGFCPWYAELSVGPYSILSPERDSVIGDFSFRMNLDGYGMPNDWEEYLRLARQDPEIRRLLSFLEGISGKEWSVLMSGSY